MPENNKPVNHPVADFGPDNPFTGAEIIYAYTRQQAIEDGVLVDVSPIAGEAGWRYPVAFTSGVWSALVTFNELASHRPGDSAALQRERVREVLHMAATVASLQEKPNDTVRFPVTRSDRITRELWAKCGPGDHAEPVVTIMLIGED